MKKIIKGVLTLSCAAMLAIGLAACDTPVVNAYDIAVQNGFQGTEAEWLLSLHGANGEDGEDLDAEKLYDAAVKNGYTGTFLEFCGTLNISVQPKNDTAQIADNMMSIVRIYCGYSVTTSGGWLGQGASTSYGTQAGSGVIIDLNKEAGNALIVTNYHVLYNKSSDQRGILSNICVYPYGAYNAFDAKDGDLYGDGIEATYVGGAMDYDIALLRVEGSEYIKNSTVTEAEIGDSDTVKVGEETFVIGNPGGTGISVTEGIVSVDSEYISISALDNRDLDRDGQIDGVSFRVMRTDAAVNGGNSGGGLFNAKGELIGIVNAKSTGSSTDNMGYALPITQVIKVCDNILDNEGKVKLATLGVMVSTKSSKAVENEDGTRSIVEEFTVATAVSNGAAAYQKLDAGDVFKAGKINDGETVEFIRRYQLSDLLMSVRKGDKVTLVVLDSNNDEKTVEILFDKDEYFTTYA